MFYYFLFYAKIILGDKMKKNLLLIILGLILLVVYLCKEDLVVFYVENFVKVDKDIKLSSNNIYTNPNDFSYVFETNNFIPSNKQDLKNIYYTILNSGVNEFTFYCPTDGTYDNCINDVKFLASDQSSLSHINNFVHPFNGFKHIETEYDSLGKITISVEKTYSEEKIKIVENEVNKILKKEILSSDSIEEKIKKVHDYIINNSKYDSNRSDDNIVNYDSDTAYGTLIEGYGLCGGYTDSMALFLTSLGIKNYKVASENHVWNALYLNDTWYHLDLTWDDPVTTDLKDVLEYNFFLITTNELKELKTDQHNFDINVYKELK